MPKIIILRESLLESILKDIVTFGLLFLFTGYGVYIQSETMEWVGFIVWILYLFTKSTKGSKQMTVKEAKDYLETLPDPETYPIGPH